MKRLFALVVLLALLAAAGLGYYAYRPLPLPATPFEFSLKQGSSLKSAARDMRQAGLLEQDWTFVWLARLLDKSAQLKAGKVVVKLHLRHTLHAKLYLCFRPDPNNPTTGFLGSSNLTLAGLSQQGELNIDVLDHDACQKLSKWFEDRWNDNRCFDISDELVQIIEESWAREALIPPYHIYIKMA